MAIWSRNRFYSGTTETPTFASGDAVSENNSTDGYITKFVISPMSSVLNRSVWFRTLKYQFLKAFVHKEEDRATSANLGVSGAEPTTTKYVTVEQLPSVDKTTNDFTGVAGSGTLINNQNTVDIIPVLTGTGKSFVAKLHTDFVAWLLARTYSPSQLTTAINNAINGSNGSSVFPVGVKIDYTGLTDPDGWLNLCLEYSGNIRSISNTAGTGTLHDNKYQALFLHLWTNYANTEGAVSGGRGASAAADWTANKDIKLPDYRGRVGGYYKLSDVNFGTLGKQIGTETINAIHLPVTAPYGVNNPPHNHGNVVIVNGASSESLDGDTVGLRASAGNTDNTTTTISLKTNDIAGGQVADGGQKHFQPTIIQTAIIKY